MEQVFLLLVVALAGCAPVAETPMRQPVDAMEVAWGPFARQCDSTRVAHDTSRWRVGQTEVAHVYKTCAGFSAMPLGAGDAQITASVGAVDQPASTVVLRMRRSTRGEARAASVGDSGLLAQGSDVPDAAEAMARGIGLTERQRIAPGESVTLPVRLSVRSKLDLVLSCRPDGEQRDRGRDTLVLSCVADQTVVVDGQEARVVLAGVEETDVKTGVRLSSLLTGHMARQGGGASEVHLVYSRETEFE